MAFFDQLKNRFKRGEESAEQDSMLSIGMPEATRFQDAVPSVEHPTAAPERAVAGGPQTQADQIIVPLLGSKTVEQHQRLLSLVLGASLVVLVIATLVGMNSSETSAQQLGAVGQSLMQSQRLAKSVTQALVGDAKAFPDVAESAKILTQSVRGLQKGDASLRIEELGTEFAPALDKVMPMVDRAEKTAAVVMGQQAVLTQVGSALRLINRQSSDLLEIAETISSLKLQQNAPASEISAAGQLVMLTQRIGKSSNEFLTVDGVSPEAVFLLGKDLNAFKDIAQGLLDGSAELRLSAAKDAQTREQLNALIALYEQTRTQAGAILGNLQGLVSAREAQVSILADSEGLRKELEQLQGTLSGRAGLSGLVLVALVLAAVLALASAGGLSYVQLLDSRQRQAKADAQRLEAQRLEQ